ncbi:hypothetical protein A2U01_0045999 [Trifolium medium]|uniref:Uncharacterized protein n=1 Tax=Trifolium medium TaxID=97028 RepID=A0A392QK79_9FABA|nr:hypothetical protein [Trifolium medium]
MLFWNLRVAQDSMARCAAKQVTPKTGSETCALRRTKWRIAQWTQETTGLVLEDVRCAGQVGVLRRWNFKRTRV